MSKYPHHSRSFVACSSSLGDFLTEYNDGSNTSSQSCVVIDGRWWRWRFFCDTIHTPSIHFHAIVHRASPIRQYAASYKQHTGSISSSHQQHTNGIPNGANGCRLNAQTDIEQQQHNAACSSSNRNNCRHIDINDSRTNNKYYAATSSSTDQCHLQGVVTSIDTRLCEIVSSHGYNGRQFSQGWTGIEYW